jgi:hypothetical protein
MTCGPGRLVAGGGREREPDERGLGVSGEGIPILEFSRVGCGFDPVLGRNGPRWPFSIFLIFFPFLFLFSFNSFANLFQIKPDQILNSSNIPH